MLLSYEPNDGTIFILLPVHNRRNTTVAFVHCLLKQTDQNFHLVLIDDGSSDGTAEAVLNICPKTTVLKGNGSWWWGGSLHQGYLYLKEIGCRESDIVLIVNDDVSFKEDYLKNGRKLIQQNPNAQIGSQYFDKITNSLADRGASCDFKKFVISAAKKDEDLAFISTRGLFIKARDFLSTEGFFPEKLPHYLSDYEFTFRLKAKHNLKMITSELIPLYGLDDKSGSSSLRGYSPIQACKIIFSERFRDNPIYLSNFISMCFPREFQKGHIKFIWISIFKRWVFTWPQPLLFFILLIVIPLRGIFRIINSLVRSVKRKRYELEGPEIK